MFRTDLFAVCNPRSLLLTQWITTGHITLLSDTSPYKTLVGTRKRKS